VTSCGPNSSPTALFPQSSDKCQRFYNGQPITLIVPARSVPQCANCGELVFTYNTEEQINLAYRTQTDAQRNGPSAKKGEEEQAGG
jgi:hypothetical protein